MNIKNEVKYIKNKYFKNQKITLYKNSFVWKYIKNEKNNLINLRQRIIFCFAFKSKGINWLITSKILDREIKQAKKDLETKKYTKERNQMILNKL